MIIRYIRKPNKVVKHMVEAGRLCSEEHGQEQLYVVRQKKCRGQPVGCIVSFQDEEGIKVGYSLLNPKDSFSKDKAKKIAIERAKACSKRTLDDAEFGLIHNLYDVETKWDHVKQEYIPDKKEPKCNSQTKKIARYILDTYDFAKKYYAKQENIHTNSRPIQTYEEVSEVSDIC